eukprot:6213799-Pleurochrysis_carterae.AAC.9
MVFCSCQCVIIGPITKVFPRPLVTLVFIQLAFQKRDDVRRGAMCGVAFRTTAPPTAARTPRSAAPFARLTHSRFVQRIRYIH